MRYEIRCDVEAAGGWQSFAVEAESEAEALAKFKEHGGEFLYEEVEVTELGTPEVMGPATPATAEE